MMMKAHICVVAAAAFIAGCGGGGASLTAVGGNQPAPDMPAKFGGALQMLTSPKQCFTQVFVLDPKTGLTTGVKDVAGYDELLFDEVGNGYRICGDQVWLAKVKGTINAPNAGIGTATVSIYNIGRGSLVNAATLSGVVFDAGANVTQIDLYDAAVSPETRMQSAYTNYSYSNDVTGSYATLAGSYVSNRPNTSLVVAADGTLSGNSSAGTITGKITKFNADTHVHSVSITFNANTGAPTTASGVLGPYSDAQYAWSITPGGKGSSSIMLAVIGPSVSYADVLSHK
ncbi:hypothetical protein [Duganella sp. BuS-21]|uniref:hypothetical protein n=1 Tax=Duganella sp. BuS-21 TaxID=2943848 RepID=UPI0035A6FE7F